MKWSLALESKRYLAASNVHHYLYMNPATNTIFVESGRGSVLPLTPGVLIAALESCFDPNELAEWLLLHRQYLDALWIAYQEDDMSLWAEAFQYALDSRFDTMPVMARPP